MITSIQNNVKLQADVYNLSKRAKFSVPRKRHHLIVFRHKKILAVRCQTLDVLERF